LIPTHPTTESVSGVGSEKHSKLLSKLSNNTFYYYFCFFPLLWAGACFVTRKDFILFYLFDFMLLN
jgi:hypothetical protein